MLIPRGKLETQKAYEIPESIKPSFPFYADFALNVLGMNKQARFSNPQRFLERVTDLWKSKCTPDQNHFEKTTKGWTLIRTPQIKGERELKGSQINWHEEGEPWAKPAAAWVAARLNKDNRNKLHQPLKSSEFDQCAYDAFFNSDDPFFINFNARIELLDMVRRYMEENKSFWSSSTEFEREMKSLDNKYVPIIHIDDRQCRNPALCIPDGCSHRPEDILVNIAAKILISNSSLFDCVSQTNLVMLAEMMFSEFDPDCYECQDDADAAYADLVMLTEESSPLMAGKIRHVSDLNCDNIKGKNRAVAAELIRNVKLHVRLVHMCNLLDQSIIYSAFDVDYGQELNTNGFILDSEEMLASAYTISNEPYGQENEERFIPFVTESPFPVTALVYSANRIVACMKTLLSDQ